MLLFVNPKRSNGIKHFKAMIKIIMQSAQITLHTELERFIGENIFPPNFDNGWTITYFEEFK